MTATALLTGAGLIAPWLVPPPPSRVWVVIWQLVMGAGFALAGFVAGADRRSRSAGLLVLAGAMLLSGPTIGAAGLAELSNGVAIAALAAVLPLALVHVVEPRPWPALMRGLDLLVLLCGGVAAIAAVAGADLVSYVAQIGDVSVLFVMGWVLFERTTGEDRRRVLWIVFGSTVTVSTAFLLAVAMDFAGTGAVLIGVVMTLLSLSLPATAAIALRDPRFLDVRDVIRRTAVLSVMFALTAAFYLGGEAAVEILTGRPPSSGVRVVLATAVAACFHPLLLRVRTVMDEMLFGGRTDPVDTLTRLGTHLAAESSPPQWLETLRAALGVPGVFLRRGAETVATAGRTDGFSVAVTELRAGAEHVGDLVVAIPSDQMRLPPATSTVLNLVATPLAQALHAAALTEKLRASQSHVVTALEEERRRMRRDLHDGLGPTLTGIAYSTDAVTNLVQTDPQQALDILRQLRADAGEAIGEIRRIVYGLRPKALDELGLVGAVRQRISHLYGADAHRLTIDIDAPDDLPDLPAAVEVVAYRVAVEAVTNVARHAGVGAATLEIALLDEAVLRVRTRDSGHSSRDWDAGVGLLSMRQRVEQIGGTLTVQTGSGGSVVSAHIPLNIAGTGPQAR